MKGKIQIAVIVILAILLLFKSCTSTEIPDPKVKIETITSLKVETKTFYDTVRIFHDSVRITDIDVTHVHYDTIKELNIYDSPFEDSLISGSIYSEIDGVLVAQNFTYVPKFPKYIIQKDSIFITRTDSVINTILEPKKLKVFVGLEVGGNKTTFNLGPKISFLTKKDILIDYNYDVINKTHNVGFNKKLKFK